MISSASFVLLGQTFHMTPHSSHSYSRDRMSTLGMMLDPRHPHIGHAEEQSHLLMALLIIFSTLGAGRDKISIRADMSGRKATGTDLC